jgi:hypothetical protein
LQNSWTEASAHICRDLLEEIGAQRDEAYCAELSHEWETIKWSYGLKLLKPCLRVSAGGSQLGGWDPESRTISVSREALESLSWDSVVSLLKHEIAHQFVDEVLGGHHNQPHGSLFGSACDRLGLLPPFRSANLRIDELRERVVRRQSLPERLRRRIERLEALTDSDNSHESGVAEDLLSRLRSEAAEVLSKTGGSAVFEDFGSQTIDLHRKRCSREQMAAAGMLSRHFGVEVVFSSAFNVRTLERSRVIVVMGRHEKVEMAVFAFNYCLAEAQRAWRHHQNVASVQAGDGPSFRLGVILGFDEALKAKAEIRVSEAGDKGGKSESNSKAASAAAPVSLVPGAQEAKVLAGFVAAQFPRLTTTTLKGGSARDGAVTAGKKVGRGMDMPNPLGGGHQRGRLLVGAEN